MIRKSHLTQLKEIKHKIKVTIIIQKMNGTVESGH